MHLPLAQLTTLKTSIAADPALVALGQSPDAAFAVAAAYNLPATPDFWVWRTRIAAREVRKNVVWTEYIGRSVGEKSAFELMMFDGELDGSDPNIRTGILDIFAGGTATTTRTNLTALAKRLATRSEKLFAAGTGTNATPATMAVEGDLNYQDVLDAWARG